ncbi:MAG: hypothetical protein Q9195_003849 [Heterodermia aff. obscurata]
MHFFHHYILNVLLPLLLPSLVFCSPHPSAVPTKPSHSHHSRKFTLKSHVISPPNPAFDNLDLEPYHIYPAFNYAVFVSGQTGIVGYLNGTRQDFADYTVSACSNIVVALISGEKRLMEKGDIEEEQEARTSGRDGNLLFDGGSNIVYGFIIDKLNGTYNPIEINAGPGSSGIYINQGVIKYNNPTSGGFYACNATLLYGPAVQVFWKPKFITTPAGCSDVELKVNYV